MDFINKVTEQTGKSTEKVGKVSPTQLRHYCKLSSFAEWIARRLIMMIL